MIWKKLGLSLLVALALIAGGVHWRASQRERAAEAAYPPQGQFVTVDGRRVHAVVTGSGPDLVLIHGSGGNTRDFTHRLTAQLAGRYRVVVFDRPGLGWSDRLPPGAEGIHEQAAQLRGAADALGLTKPIVLGQSYGAAVALAWALDAPESLAAVVSISGPSHPWDGPLPWVYRLNANPLGAALAVPLITAFVGYDRVAREIAPVFAPQSMPEGYAQYFGIALTLKRTALRANAAHRASLNTEIIALQPRYADFPVPMEIVHGDADTTVSLHHHATRMVDETAQAHLTVLPGIGHMPHHGAQPAIIAAIDRAAARAGLR